MAPPAACRAISPASARWDRLAKPEAYARHGVQWLWLVDPATELLEAYSLHQARWLRLAAWFGDDVARVPPFDAIELELTPLWVREGEAPPAGARIRIAGVPAPAIGRRHTGCSHVVLVSAASLRRDSRRPVRPRLVPAEAERRLRSGRQVCVPEQRGDAILARRGYLIVSAMSAADGGLIQVQ